MSLVFYTHRQINPCLGEFTVHAAGVLTDCRQEVSQQRSEVELELQRELSKVC